MSQSTPEHEFIFEAKTAACTCGDWVARTAPFPDDRGVGPPRWFPIEDFAYAAWVDHVRTALGHKPVKRGFRFRTGW